MAKYQMLNLYVRKKSSISRNFNKIIWFLFGKPLLASFIPGFMLATFYIIYIITVCFFDPSKGPTRKKEDLPTLNERIKLLKKLIAPLY